MMPKKQLGVLAFKIWVVFLRARSEEGGYSTAFAPDLNARNSTGLFPHLTVDRWTFNR